MKINFLALVVCLFTGLSFAQQNNSSFFVQIVDNDYVFIQTHDLNDNRINVFNSLNQNLNQLVFNYNIYKCERVFKNSKKTSLQNVYLVECNDIKLMSELENSFTNIYSDLHDAEVEILAIPNDFGITGGFSEYQEELNYIRAPEAWDITTSSSDIVIGVADTNVDLNHEDLVNKVSIAYGNNNPNGSQHGSNVSSVAAADTNNSLGMSSIGYDSKINFAANSYVTGVDQLSQKEGVKVINTAWVSSYGQDVYNEVVEDRKVVVVAAAGNGIHPGSTQYVYPAAFKNVISVSSIAHEDNNWTDVWGNTFVTEEDHHSILFNSMPNMHQHNDSVDIVAPGFGVLIARTVNGAPSYVRSGGTSYAAPMVSGTVALMFSVNYCLEPKEIESILKLTAVKIDDIPANIQYNGKLGAGKLDAYEAVKMAKDMADEYGTVEVKDRILYRWFYKLETAPYEIKMTNNDVTGNARLKFKARDNIEILSGDYYPSTGGYVDLSIDTTLTLDSCTLPPASSSKMSNQQSEVKESQKDSKYTFYPILVDNYITIESLNNGKNVLDDVVTIKVFDFYGNLVYEKSKVNSKKERLNLEKLKSGIHILKVYNLNNEELQTTKIVKN